MASANLKSADLRATNLIQTDLTNSNLEDADLTATNLYGANLNGANLRNASLKSANLAGVTFVATNCDGANFAQTILEQNVNTFTNNLIPKEDEIPDSEDRSELKFPIPKQVNNQGRMSEKVFDRKAKQLIIYNEMKLASKAEYEIAKVLEDVGVLFFPLPLAVKRETGIPWQDHREPDFLVCLDGTWGILEVSFHSDRYEQDCEKTSWFQRAGILCVKCFTAERCHHEPKAVVDEFLTILSKYKR